ncbi:uncharacterized protein LOC107522427 [Erinaceus europaeus]|uniref:Uncharacterized protein LOC107522427 n=1 Tax=Erinaceus europaeus TaxID=9365 RepID=A0A1S3W9A0_ERIEU|nr:uncharacterized protein LOC107522427 [Erinaceus europaeus]
MGRRSLRGHQTQAPPPHCPAIFSAPPPPPPPPTGTSRRPHRQAPPPPCSQRGLAASRPLPRGSPPSRRCSRHQSSVRVQAAAASSGPREFARCLRPSRRRPLPQRAKPLSSPRLPRRRRRSAVTHAQSAPAPFPLPLPLLSFPSPLAVPLSTPSTPALRHRLAPRMRAPLPYASAFSPHACALTRKPDKHLSRLAPVPPLSLPTPGSMRMPASPLTTRRLRSGSRPCSPPLPHLRPGGGLQGT